MCNIVGFIVLILFVKICFCCWDSILVEGHQKGSANGLLKL